MSNLATPSSVWDLGFDFNGCQSQMLFAFLLRMSWHQYGICMMFRSGFIDEYAIFGDIDFGITKYAMTPKSMDNIS